MSDPFSSNVVLLLHMNGSNGSEVFTDSSGLPKLITRYGNASISTAQSKWNGSSGYLDGSGDYLNIQGNFNLSSNDFTIELWCYCNDQTTNYPTMISTQGGWSDGAFSLRFDNAGLSGKFSIHWNGVTPGDPFIATALTYSFNQWRHVAVVRSGTSVIMYVDGQSAASGTVSAGKTLDLGMGGALRVGWATWDGANGYYQGYLQDIRITQDIARYTANFTPPAEPFPDPDPVTGRIMQSGLRADIEDGGGYRIVGTATELGVAGAFRVRLFHRISGRCIREVWSNPDGSFAFNYLKYLPSGYFVVAFDHTDSPLLNAAIADLITPELMP